MVETECYEKYLYGKSMKISKDTGITGYFDLFVFVVGWESRCSEVIDFFSPTSELNSGIILSFETIGVKGYELRYMEKVRSFVEKKTEIIHELEDEPNNFKILIHKVEQIIINLALSLNRPLIIGFDITSCPRLYFLHLLAFCLKHNISKSLSFFYSEGIQESETREFIRTRGEWKIIETPGFESEVNPEQKNLFIASAGFEGKRCKSLFFKYEPEDMGILLPSPGYNEEYTRLAEETCLYLKEDFSIPADNIVLAPAGDAIAAWEILKKKSLNRENYNVSYITLGPKPHTLAMGIHGFLNRYTLTYRIPEVYIKAEVKSTGIFWQYDVKNLLFL
jgi:hypothetical protein